MNSRENPWKSKREFIVKMVTDLKNQSSSPASKKETALEQRRFNVHLSPPSKNQASGIFNLAPTTMRSFSKPFAALRALTVVPCVLAIRVKVSPGLMT